jgi:hypothetical protein
MSKICYVSRRFSASSLETIVQANRIIVDYQKQGLTLTLRQLYYRFVAGALIPNQQKEYKKLGSTINDGRLAGLIDWDAIEDRGRSLNDITAWSNPAEIIRAAANGYAIDLWQGQRYRVEVWVEKQALEAVIEDAAKPLACPSYACKGYVSQSEMWRAANRLKRYERAGQTAVIIHLGDHDPSGVDMTRDIRDRLVMFGAHVQVKRIALNMDQIQQYNPPPNPAKTTDSRSMEYIAQHGEESWELDALEPAVLRSLIQKTILSYRDNTKYDLRVARQETERKQLLEVSDNWKHDDPKDDAAGFLEEPEDEEEQDFDEDEEDEEAETDLEEDDDE